MARRSNARRAGTQVKALLPVTIPHGGIRYAQGVRAGRWIFATGHKAAVAETGAIAPEVLAAALPHWGKPRLRREADRVFRNLAAVIEAGGSDFDNVVRVDQNYTSGAAVEAYHDARRAALRDHIPPSTSTLAAGFLLPDQNIEVNMIAVEPAAGFKPVHIRPEREQKEVHASSGYSLALGAGDFVFVAGRYADSPTFGAGIAPEARVPAGHLWKGLAIKLEAEHVITKKILPALEAAGSSLASVVKCQVYMRDLADFAAFNEVWSRHFPRAQPATTLIPTATPGFAIRDLRLEINTIALRDGARTQRKVIDAGVVPAFRGYSQAVRAGDLLFIPGMLAIDRNGLIEAARADPAQPYFGSAIQAQMDYLLANAQRLCLAAGTSLANVVRIQQYHTDLAEFYPAYQTWQRHLPGHYLPYSAVQVPFLPVPGATVMLDLWVYAP